MERRTSGLPKSVMILGQRFKVKVEDLMTEHSLYGSTVAREQIIKVDKALSSEQQRQTLFHECVHAALGVSGVTEVLSSKDIDIEEAVVTAIENGLWPLVRNSWFKDK